MLLILSRLYQDFTWFRYKTKYLKCFSESRKKNSLYIPGKNVVSSRVHTLPLNYKNLGCKVLVKRFYAEIKDYWSWYYFPWIKILNPLKASILLCFDTNNCRYFTDLTRFWCDQATHAESLSRNNKLPQNISKTE